MVEERRMPLGASDKRYFEELGRRIYELRKAKGLTQTELGEALGFSQQHVHGFEKGIRRVPVSLLPKLASVLGVSFEDLLGEQRRKRSKRGPRSKLERQFEVVSQLSKRKQQLVSEMLDAIIVQAQQAS